MSNVVQLVLDNMAQEKVLFNIVLILLEQHCTGKTLCNIVQEPPDNLTQEKILFNVVLILLGQHCAGKNLLQCCQNRCR